MTTIEQRIILLAQAIGADIKQLDTAQGDLTALPTSAKTNLVAAIAELYDMANGTVRIDDQAGVGAVGVTYSVDKILDSILVAKNALKDELLGGAGEALDTLQELGAALGNDADFAATVASQLALRLRVDAEQTLTEVQKAQGRTNLGAASVADLSTEAIARADADAALSGRIDSLESNVGGAVGNTADLATVDKSTIVAAINEVHGEVDAEVIARDAADTALGLRIDGVESDLSALTAVLGDTDVDFASLYAAAKE